jgi:hypothetical protein
MHKAHEMIVINLNVHMKYTRSVLFGYSKVKLPTKIKLKYCSMKRKFIQWWSTISSKSTRRTITSHLYSMNTKKDHDIWWRSPGLGQAQKCGRLNWLMGSQSSPLDNWISNIHDHDTISSNKIETNIYTDKAKRCYENLYLLIIIQC